MDWVRFVCFAAILTATIAMKNKPLDGNEILGVKVMMGYAANSRDHPDTEAMIAILYDEAPNDATAIVSRSLDRVIKFLHLIFPNVPKLQTLSNIEEAEKYLSEKLSKGEKIDVSLTFSYYGHVLLKILEVHNEVISAVHRIGAFLACSAHSQIGEISEHDVESNIKEIMEYVQIHLSREPKDFSALVTDVNGLVKNGKKATIQIPTSFGPLTTDEINNLKAMMDLAAKSSEQPDMKLLIVILYGEAPNDNAAVISRSLDRVIQFLRLLFPDGPRLQTISSIEEARDYLKKNLIQKKVYRLSTFNYFSIGIIGLCNSHNEDFSAVKRVGACVAYYVHSQIHDILDMESTINTAMKYAETHLTKEPKDFSALMTDVEAYLTRVKGANIPIQEMTRQELLKRGFEKGKALLKKAISTRILTVSSGDTRKCEGSRASGSKTKSTRGKRLQVKTPSGRRAKTSSVRDQWSKGKKRNQKRETDLRKLVFKKQNPSLTGLDV